MKYINKILLLVGATVFFSGLLISVFPQHTQAALSMEDDYRIYRSYTLVYDCLAPGLPSSNLKRSNRQDTIDAVFNSSKEVQDGKLYSNLAGNSAGGFDCNTYGDIGPALEALGYDSVYDFAEVADGKTASEIQSILRDQVKKEGGRLDLLNKPDFQYWFWNSIYRNSVSSGGCDGVLNDTYSDNRKTNSDGEFWKVEGDGTAKKFKVASYNVDTGREVEGIDGSMTDGKKWTCFEIAKQLTQGRAEAYGTRLKANASDDDASNDYSVDPSVSANGIADTESCESVGGVLSWVMCPVVEMLGAALNWVDTQISRLLEIDENKIDNEQLYQVWANFRNIGLTLLIIAMLVMVISTALGLGFLDAYTVKKAMPRMVAAIIFMLLSWYICIFMITVTNAIGEGTLGIMTAPFDGKAESLSALFNPSGGGAAVQGGSLLIGVGVLALVPGALGIVMSWFGAALLIIGIALLVLVARQMFIITLIVFAPIAILTWIFPGNDKGWKFWWQSFSKLLLMYPMIMALIAAGRIFAGVISFASDAGSGESLINPLLKLTAYVIPYAFIPFTFKFAGGVFGNLAGMVNDRSKGAFDRLRKGRQQKYGEIGRNMKGGVGFRGSSSNPLNRVSSGVAAGPGGWIPTAGGKDRRRASRETGMMLAGQAQLENDRTHKMWKNNDAYLLAMADEDLANKMLGEKIAARDQAVVNGDYDKVESLNQDIRNRQGAIGAARSINNKTAATRRQAAMELASTGYQLAEGEDGYRQLEAISRSINGSDDSAHAQFMDNAQFNLKQAGRFDLAGINHGAGYDAGSGVNKAGLYQLGNSKPESIGAMVTAAGDPATKATLTDAEQTDALVLHKELKAMLPNTTGAVRDKVVESLQALEASGHVDPGKGATLTGRQVTVAEPVKVPYSIAQAASDLAAGDGWTADEISRGARYRGTRNVVKDETLEMVAEQRARSYERPDPNKIP